MATYAGGPRLNLDSSGTVAMKPILKSAPETAEDFDVWLWVQALRFRRYGKMQHLRYKWSHLVEMEVRTRESDRRDAALMLVAVRYPMLAALQNPEFPGYRIDIRQGTGHGIAHLKIYVTGDRGIT